MNLAALILRYRQSADLKAQAANLYAQSLAKSQPNATLELAAMEGAEAVILHALVHWMQPRHLFLMASEAEALALLEIWEDLARASPNTKLLFFPATPADNPAARPETEFFRNQCLQTLAEVSGSENMQDTQLIILSYADAMLTPIASARDFAQLQVKLSLGQGLSYQKVVEILHSWGFQQQDFVYTVGSFALRGAVMDIYPYNTELPLRVEWDGDEIIRLRYFELSSQLSCGDKLNSLIIVGKESGQSPNCSLLDWAEELDMQLWLRDMQGAHKLAKYGSGKLWTQAIAWNPELRAKENLELIPGFARNLDNLLTHIHQLAKAGYEIHICAKELAKANRLCSLIQQQSPELKLYPQALGLTQGFIDHSLKLALYAEQGFFKRPYHPRRRKILTQAAKPQLDQLQVGDYVTHFDYGLGLFSGLQRVETMHGIEERIRLIYKNNDVLWVGIHSLHKLSKWTFKDSESKPELSLLGSTNWTRLKDRAKAKIKHLAIDLLKLYAERSQQLGYAFSPDTLEQSKFEAGFLYEDTLDQAQATADVKRDMQASRPMDRLICGDVGFGKTEIAMRAAFKAVQDLKQVVVMAPTTVLVFQHYHNFQARMQGFGIKIDYLSRLKTAKARMATIRELAAHKIDIIIGTQALLGKDVQFADLGLLIVDEEQKFGVAAKERLRSIKQNIDCLTLSATPIPRTLQFSLMGIRDISLMKTPPKDRLPVITRLENFDAEYIQQAIRQELARGGQVYFIHNRVQNLEYMLRLLAELVPEAAITYTHGQMQATELEARLLAFVNHEYDILLSTNIIENGIDIPNVNTILINRAEHFGLSDLHQLRGRVGRAEKQAYCHLLVNSVDKLSKEAREKLASICAFANLGSGFQVALKDLDLRGVGNLFGAEQSGFLQEIGIEVYQSLLDETLRELHLNSETSPIYIKEPAVEVDIPLAISDQYISSDAERFNVYRKIASISTAEDENSIRSMLQDRFGKPPQEVENLFILRRVRLIASQCGIEKISLKNQGLRLVFVCKQQFPHFYDSPLFQRAIDCASNMSKNHQASVREYQERLLLCIENIHSMPEIENIVRQILHPPQQASQAH